MYCISAALTFTILVARAAALGSMAPIAASYGENGRAFCGVRGDGSNTVDCYGSDAAAVYGAPSRIAFAGVTGGDGFICGLGLVSRQPFCWGNNAYVQQGLSAASGADASDAANAAATDFSSTTRRNVSYVEISAGDNHLCALRNSGSGGAVTYEENGGGAAPMVDCWGYNVTGSFVSGGAAFTSLTSGSLFSCGIFAQNGTAFCWGDDTGSGVITGVPVGVSFTSISAGGYHVCGMVKNSGGRVFCWGKSIDSSSSSSSSSNSSSGGSNREIPSVEFSALVGGKFHECGLRAVNRTAVCWGMNLPNATPPPAAASFLSIAAGDYFTCGVAESDLQPVCWGSNFPSTPPSTSVTVVPGLCSPQPCKQGMFKFNRTSGPAAVALCQDPVQDVCLKCTEGCPPGMMITVPCTPDADRLCGFNCSDCQGNRECLVSCRNVLGRRRGFPIQAPIIAGELILGVIFILIVVVVIVWVRNRVPAESSSPPSRAGKHGSSDGRNGSSVKKSRTTSKKSSFRTSLRRQAEVWAQEELKMAKAHRFTYAELEQATDDFCKENEIGRGSFSMVFKGNLTDGRVVAVKKSIINPNANLQFSLKESKDFHNELDLLSRLNHAHLLNLLGYCDENGERLLVYEYMANGTLHEHLHGKLKRNVRKQGGSVASTSSNGSHSNEEDIPKNVVLPRVITTEYTRPPLSWVRRVKIAVQAARGLEYLHGYACPSVIHRDIKSSNILLDEEWNARVADFGLSLLGPADSAQPLSELPAGTLGYLDPEYYRLHYLTPKSDVYSFGVLLLEMLSGRRAIDLQFEEGNVVEWAVPLIKAGKITDMLDPRLEQPQNSDALKKVARVAARCVRMRGRERPAMGKVTTSLERALALLLMGSGSGSRLILPTEVILGSTRMHSRGGSMRSSNSGARPGRRRRGSSSEMTVTTTTGMCCSQVEYMDGAIDDVDDDEDEYYEGDERVPLDNPVLASLTFPSVSADSSKRRGEDVFRPGPGSSLSETELNGNAGTVFEVASKNKPEIGPASPVPAKVSRLL